MAESPNFTAEETRFLREAAAYLEHPGFVLRAANLVGMPAEGILNALPARAQALISDVTTAALDRSLDWAVRSLPRDEARSLKRWRMPGGQHFHTAMTATTGAVGGLFGLIGAGLEIPATTTLMLRSIAEIAAKNESQLDDPAVRLQCIAVFSFGSPSLEKMESAYVSSRLGMSLAMRDAANYLARHSADEIGTALSRKGAPVLVRFLHKVASRFKIVITQKLAAQAVPIAGAAMGSLINAAFMDHFNRVANFHFGIVRLERQYGQEAVQTAYETAAAASRDNLG